MIGDAGLTPGVLHEVDLALKSHELIKVRVLGGDRERREGIEGEICTTLDASPVQHIGKILVLFRERPEPAAGEKKPAPRRGSKGRRRTKRSFQN